MDNKILKVLLFVYACYCVFFYSFLFTDFIVFSLGFHCSLEYFTEFLEDLISNSNSGGVFL